MISEAPSGPTCDCRTGFRAANLQHLCWHFAQALARLGDRVAITATSTSVALSRSLSRRGDTIHRHGRDGTPGLHRWNTAHPLHWRTAACGRGRYTTTASSARSSPTPPTPMDATHRSRAHSYRLAQKLSSTISSSIRQSASASAWHTDLPIQRASAITSAPACRFKVVSCQSQLPAFPAFLSH